jgi:predicted nucleic acid-binding protein
VSFTVVYDACVLFPNALRDFLVRLGMSGLFRAKWSGQILDEVFRNIREKYPDIKPERLERTRRLMTEAVRGCIVERYEDLVDTIELPDLDDRHVVAAAIRSGAQVIVTFNLKDFPAKLLERYDLEVQHPDDFVLNVIDLDAPRVARLLVEQARALQNPPMTPTELVDRLVTRGLAQSMAALRSQIVDESDS